MNSAIDAFLEAGATLDWITPTLSICGELFHGEAVFCIPADDWRWVYPKLRSAGVRNMHHCIHGGYMLFNVPGNQAQRAMQILGVEA
jgi:hypothetical protein